AWPASRAERGTLSSASPADTRTSSVSPLASRSSASFVWTHVSGQRRPVTSSVWTMSGTVAAGMGRPSFLILHGYAGSGPGHWQTWLAGRLRALDATVAYPDLPDAEAPQLRSWLEALDGELAALADPPVVLCHSLACLLWLHHAATGGRPAERLLLVAPPSPAR